MHVCVVAGQSRSAKLYLDHGDCYDLIGKVLYILSLPPGVQSLTTASHG